MSLVPARTASWVPATDPAPTASATGSRCTPAESGPYPLTNWKYWVIRKMKPNRVKNDTVTAPLAALNRMLRNSRTSSIGCAAVPQHAVQRGQQDSRGGKTCQAPYRSPPVGRRLDDGEDQQCHGC